jgi:two-component system, chemotaxis family, chemotaxis protein CheY
MAGWILLLEDDLDGREVLAELLSSTGYEVVACPDVEEAEAALDRHGRPSLVLTDLMLQEMPGTDFVVRMRNRPGHEFVPVIYVTGMEPSLLADVADPIVTKPFDAEHLLELVAEHVPPPDSAPPSAA